MEFNAPDSTQQARAGWLEEKGLRRDLIPGYLLEREIGRGATGTVYLARDEAARRSVAIKILSPWHSQFPESLERMEREARTLERLRNPHIVRGFAHGVAEGRPYFVMEYVMGETLAALLRRRGRLPLEEALEITEAVALALEEAHRHQIIHRDIKPANIIRDEQGVIKLMDFGLARLVLEPAITSQGMILGTPVYISPEQAAGEVNLDIRADLFALGITLFHMLAGEPPFSELNTSLLLTKKITDDIPDPRLRAPDLPESAAALILRMCQRERQRRIPDPAALLTALRRVRRGEPPEAASTADSAAGRPKTRRQAGPPRPEDVQAPVLRALLENPETSQNIRSLDTNEILFYEDDLSRECYVLLVGRLEALKAGRPIAVIEQSGAFIGEMSTMLNAPRTATVRALEPTALLELSEDRFHDFLTASPELAWSLAVTLAQRLESTNRRLRDTLGKLDRVRAHLRSLRRETGE